MADEPLWLTEADVVSTIGLPDAIAEVEHAFSRQAAGAASAMEKTHVEWGGHTLHALGAVDHGLGLAGTKTWAHTGGGATPLVVVWDIESGRLVGVIEAFALGQLRTAAVTGVATRWLAAPDARVVSVIGSGRQALPQLAAVAAVRAIDVVRVHSPSPEHRRRFAECVRAFGAFEVEEADDVAGATKGADIIVTVTRATNPFLGTDDVEPTAHVNAIGAITPERRELAAGLIEDAELIAVDSVDAAHRLAAELDVPRPLVRLCDVLAGRARRSGSGRTVFKAMGTGIADISLAASVLERTRAAGLGRPLPHPERPAPRLKEHV